MSKSDELPDPWTHEPHDFLVYREGDRIEDVAVGRQEQDGGGG